MAIRNDSEFKTALQGLSPDHQRLAAARFAEHVLRLSTDVRLKGALAPAMHADISDDELAIGLRIAKAASVDSYTQCGHECDWNKQASHFVAEAVLDCVKPAQIGINPAWEAAMHARMARTCHTIATGKGTDNDEAAEQYRLLTEYINH
jgi:hypothetical protein